MASHTDGACCVCWEAPSTPDSRLLCCGKDLCRECASNYVATSTTLAGPLPCPHCTQPLDNHPSYAEMISTRRKEIRGPSTTAIRSATGLQSRVKHVVEEVASGLHKAALTCRCPQCRSPIVRNGGCPRMCCSVCGCHFHWVQAKEKVVIFVLLLFVFIAVWRHFIGAPLLPAIALMPVVVLKILASAHPSVSLRIVLPLVGGYFGAYFVTHFFSIIPSIVLQAVNAVFDNHVLRLVSALTVFAFMPLRHRVTHVHSRGGQSQRWTIFATVNVTQVVLRAVDVHELIRAVPWIAGACLILRGIKEGRTTIRRGSRLRGVATIALSAAVGLGIALL